MGMFDDIQCEMPLPGPVQARHNSFQTKDFDCEMDGYLITADGLLKKKAWPNSELITVPFHGYLNFYTFEDGKREEENSMWFEYAAKFTDGKCVGIECIEIARIFSGKPREVIYEQPAPETTTANNQEK